MFNFRTEELPNVTLRPGMTLAIEPILNAGSKACRTLRDQWTVVTSDGAAAAHWEHSVAITDEGPWVLTSLEGTRL